MNNCNRTSDKMDQIAGTTHRQRTPNSLIFLFRFNLGQLLCKLCPSSCGRIVRDECGTLFGLLFKVLKTKSLAYIVSMRYCNPAWDTDRKAKDGQLAVIYRAINVWTLVAFIIETTIHALCWWSSKVLRA